MTASALAAVAHEGQETFVRRNWFVVVLMVEVVVLYLIMYVYHKVWKRNESKRAKAASVSSLCESYSLELLRWFVPEAKVDKYRFRGLRQKDTPMTIQFEDLGFELHDGRRVLDGVTGEFPAGKLCAIMGPSGAGKTTFFNVLCGKANYGKMSGKVLINGKESTVDEHRNCVGFVPQEDIVHETLTVGEQIRFAAELRNSTAIPAKRRCAIAEDVLKVMQIDHIRDSIVGGLDSRGISGGQRKRVSIGLELAADPSICFLDEPTSGLDASSSLAVINSLRRIAQIGMTCAMVIHQPRSSLFKLFDRIILLGNGGRTVYQGAVPGARRYFERLGYAMPEAENPADWLMDVIAGDADNDRDIRPDQLPGLWATRRERSISARDLGEEEEEPPRFDEQLLQARVEERWSGCALPGDPAGGRLMTEEDLLRLVKGANRLESSLEEQERAAVHELLQRITGKTDTPATQAEVLEFLAGLASVVARDRNRLPSSKGIGDGTANTLRRNLSSLLQNHDNRRLGSGLLATAVSDGGSGSSTESGSEESEADSSDSGDAEDPSSRSLYGRRAASRGPPGLGRQFLLLTHRTAISWWRMNARRSIFIGVTCFGAVLLSVMDRYVQQTPQWMPNSSLYNQVCLALLTAIFSLNIFGADQHIFRREAASGIIVTSLFGSKTMVFLVDILVQCFLFTSFYYMIRQPMIYFSVFFRPYFMISWTASGLGYFVSTLVPRENGPFVTALLVFISCILLGTPEKVAALQTGNAFELITSCLSITRWSLSWSMLDYFDNVFPYDPKVNQDPAALQVEAQMRATYVTDDMFPPFVLGMRVELLFLLLMGILFRAGALLNLLLTYKR